MFVSGTPDVKHTPLCSVHSVVSELQVDRWVHKIDTACSFNRWDNVSERQWAMSAELLGFEKVVFCCFYCTSAISYTPVKGCLCRVYAGDGSPDYSTTNTFFDFCGRYWYLGENPIATYQTKVNTNTQHKQSWYRSLRLTSFLLWSRQTE